MATLYPKVTIVTVCLNAVNDIEKTLTSVVNQTYPNIEYIIIDGGSNDGTINIIEKYIDKIKYYISEPDEGIYNAMNKGIKIATGEWINFMNAGDYFYQSQTVSLFIENIKNVDADIVYGDTNCIYNGYGEIIRKPYQIFDIKKHMVFCHQSCFVKTEIMKSHPFSLKYKIASDYNFFYN